MIVVNNKIFYILVVDRTDTITIRWSFTRVEQAWLVFLLFSSEKQPWIAMRHDVSMPPPNPNPCCTHKLCQTTTAHRLICCWCDDGLWVVIFAKLSIFQGNAVLVVSPLVDSYNVAVKHRFFEADFTSRIPLNDWQVLDKLCWWLNSSPVHEASMVGRVAYWHHDMKQTSSQLLRLLIGNACLMCWILFSTCFNVATVEVWIYISFRALPRVSDWADLWKGGSHAIHGSIRNWTSDTSLINLHIFFLWSSGFMI